LRNDYFEKDRIGMSTGMQVGAVLAEYIGKVMTLLLHGGTGEELTFAILAGTNRKCTGNGKI